MSKRSRDETDSVEPKMPKKVCVSASRCVTHDNEDIWAHFNVLPEKPDKKEHKFKTHVSGTDVKNFLLRDPLLDWLDHYYNTKVLADTHLSSRQKESMEQKIQSEKSHLSVLFEKGNDFENKVCKYLHDNFPSDIITINTTGRSGCTPTNCARTKDAMIKGIPIIEQAVLINDKNMTMGVADLLIRSDFINKVIDRKVLSKKESHYKAPLLTGNYHYRVIDIKWTTMTLCANGINVRNDARFPAYKGQLAIYTSAVGLLQGYTPRQAYIMAKAWKIDKKGEEQDGYCCFDLLGTIDYNGFDYQYIQKTIDAIEWIRELRSHGKAWNPHEPHREEMYPNASNKFDAPWTDVKKSLAMELDEITQIWYVSVPNRIYAHEQGIMSWKDEKCTSTTLGITGTYKPAVIDGILTINRNSTGTITPHKIKNNDKFWQTKSAVDFYVDFETVNESLKNDYMDIFNNKNNADLVFMIGVGYEQNGVWHYRDFTAKDLSLFEEEYIFDQFTAFITEKSKELDPANEYVPRLFHWSNAEIANLDHAEKRHDKKWLKWESTIAWVDMYHVFTSEPILVKGSLNFRLKTIGKAMYSLKFIKTLWDDAGPSDGFSAMFDAIEYYESKDKKLMNGIIKYNEVDCKVIYEIVEYLRNHHV
jgi:hypothetical protein